MARALSYESIHKHDAYAEGGGTLEELRSQILGGQDAAQVLPGVQQKLQQLLA